MTTFRERLIFSAEPQPILAISDILCKWGKHQRSAKSLGTYLYYADKSKNQLLTADNGPKQTSGNHSPNPSKD